MSGCLLNKQHRQGPAMKRRFKRVTVGETSINAYNKNNSDKPGDGQNIFAPLIVNGMYAKCPELVELINGLFILNTEKQRLEKAQTLLDLYLTTAESSGADAVELTEYGDSLLTATIEQREELANCIRAAHSPDHFEEAILNLISALIREEPEPLEPILQRYNIRTQWQFGRDLAQGIVIVDPQHPQGRRIIFRDDNGAELEYHRLFCAFYDYMKKHFQTDDEEIFYIANTWHQNGQVAMAGGFRGHYPMHKGDYDVLHFYTSALELVLYTDGNRLQKISRGLLMRNEIEGEFEDLGVATYSHHFSAHKKHTKTTYQRYLPGSYLDRELTFDYVALSRRGSIELDERVEVKSAITNNPFYNWVYAYKQYPKTAMTAMAVTALVLTAVAVTIGVIFSPVSFTAIALLTGGVMTGTVSVPSLIVRVRSMFKNRSKYKQMKKYRLMEDNAEKEIVMHTPDNDFVGIDEKLDELIAYKTLVNNIARDYMQLEYKAPQVATIATIKPVLQTYFAKISPNDFESVYRKIIWREHPFIGITPKLFKSIVHSYKLTKMNDIMHRIDAAYEWVDKIANVAPDNIGIILPAEGDDVAKLFLLTMIYAGAPHFESLSTVYAYLKKNEAYQKLLKISLPEKLHEIFNEEPELFADLFFRDEKDELLCDVLAKDKELLRALLASATDNQLVALFLSDRFSQQGKDKIIEDEVLCKKIVCNSDPFLQELLFTNNYFLSLLQFRKCDDIRHMFTDNVGSLLRKNTPSYVYRAVAHAVANRDSFVSYIEYYRLNDSEIFNQELKKLELIKDEKRTLSSSSSSHDIRKESKNSKVKPSQEPTSIDTTTPPTLRRIRKNRSDKKSKSHSCRLDFKSLRNSGISVSTPAMMNQ